MLLWTAIAALTAAAVMSVLWPLSRPARAGAARPEVEVYRDQLDELERDRARGLVGAGEAEAARAEIARRLLGAARGERGATLPEASNRRRRAAALVGLVALPALALGLYVALGSPFLPAQPLAARLDAPAMDDVAAQVAAIERHLAANPEDGRGWEVLAPVYLGLGQAQDAAAAYRNAIRLLGDTAEWRVGLGEAIVLAAGGIVTDEAAAEFARALEQGPEPRARFYLALSRAQEGDLAGALADWRALLAEAPAGASWRQAVEEQIAGAEAGLARASGAPSAEDVARADAMPEAERAEFVAGMVEGLHARLTGGEKDLEGWLRLVRSYAVLERGDEAEGALGEARRLFAGDEAALARLDALASSLGLSARS